AGRCQIAVGPLELSLRVDGRPGRAVLNWLWLALAYQKRGKAEEALRWLDKATGWLDQQEGRMPLDTSFLGVDRHHWLAAHVLRKEAKTLLRELDCTRLYPSASPRLGGNAPVALCQ